MNAATALTVRLKMHSLPINFSSEAFSTGEFESPWSIKSGPVQAACAIPSEFGGYSGGFSPEDLFLQAVINCFVGTFKVYAKASRINFTDLHVKGKLTVDQGETKKVFMKTVVLDITIGGAERPDRIETIVAKTMREGFILNSVKSEIRHNLQVRTSSSDKLF